MATLEMARYSSKGNALSLPPAMNNALLSLPPAMNNALLYSVQAMESPARADIERWRAAGQAPTQYEENLMSANPVIRERGLFAGIPRYTNALTGELDPGAVQSTLAGITQMPLLGVAAGAKLPANALGAALFHGTGLPPRGPGKAPFDRFDISKVGGPGGEGAQAFGHGLYFAESPGTAKSYQKLLGNRMEIDGGLPDWENPSHVAAAWLSNFKGDKKAAVDYLRTLPANTPAGSRRAGEAAADIIESGGAIPKVKTMGGSLIEADIPDTEIAKMLDWDKPLSEQPENVKKAFEKIQGEIGADLVKENPLLAASELGRKRGTTGGDIYQRLSNQPHLIPGFRVGQDSRQAASEYLRQRGIPGIKYLDQGSRATGEGTRNLVVFDDNIITIKSVNGEPVR